MSIPAPIQAKIAEIDGAREAYVGAVELWQKSSSAAHAALVQENHSRLVMLQLELAAAENNTELISHLRGELEQAPALPRCKFAVTEADAWRQWNAAYAEVAGRSAEDKAAALFAVNTLQKYIEKNFQIPTIAFSRLLIETQAVLGGSMPLQGILQTEFYLSDMDIYIPTTSSRSEFLWAGFMQGAGWRLYRKSDARCQYMRNRNPRLGDAIKSVHTYYKSVSRSNSSYRRGTFVQLIFCHSVQRVLASVDLSCTTAFYDGKTILALEDIPQMRQKIAFLRFPFEHLVKNEADNRIYKYQCRGMKIGRSRTDPSHVYPAWIYNNQRHSCYWIASVISAKDEVPDAIHAAVLKELQNSKKPNSIGWIKYDGIIEVIVEIATRGGESPEAAVKRLEDLYATATESASASVSATATASVSATPPATGPLPATIQPPSASATPPEPAPASAVPLPRAFAPTSPLEDNTQDMEEGLHHILNETLVEEEEDILNAYENPDPESLELAEAAAAAYAAAAAIAHPPPPVGAEFAPPEVRAALNALTYNPLL